MPTSYFDMLRQPEQNEPKSKPVAVSYFDMLRQPEAPQAAIAPATRGEVSPEAAQAVTDEMGAGERALVGFGRGLTVFGRGINQLGLEAAGALGFDAKDSLAELNAKEGEERKIFERGVGDTGAGMVGAFLGEAAPYAAVPMGAIGRATSLLGKVAAGAGIGAGIGATQFVDQGESRIGNAAQGAAFGGIATGAIDALAKGGARLANTISGRMAPRSEEVTALGKRFDVPVYAPDVAGSPVMSKVSTLSEEVPFVGMANPRLQQAEAARAAAESLAGRIAPQIDDVGRELQGSLTRRTEALQKAAGVRYDRVAKAADPLGPVPLTNMRSTAQRLLEEAKKDIDPNPALISRLENFVGSQDGNFSQTRMFRSNLGDSIRQLESSMDLKAARPLQAIRGALEKDMNEFAQQAGGDVSAKWRAADKFFRERVVPQRESDIVRASRNRNPDEVFKQFIRSGAQDRAQRLYNALDPKGRSAIKSGIMGQALEKASMEGAKGVAFSPAKFAGELERLQGSVGVFFKGADKAEIDGFTKLMRHVERAGQVAENPPTGNRVVLPLLMGETLAPGTGLSAAGSGAIARLLFTTDAGKRLLLASGKFPPGHPRVERAILEFRNRAPAALATQEQERAGADRARTRTEPRMGLR